MVGGNAVHDSAGGRPFEEAWRELERRHAWKIRVVECLNPKPAVSRFAFVWSDYDNRHAAAFRERHRLHDVVAGARDDWEALLRLRHWTFVNMINDTDACLHAYGPFYSMDPAALVAASHSGGTFWCTYFSTVFIAAATSMGLPARKVAIDCEHTAAEKSTQHGVADVWVNTFRKWVHMDPNYDHHYELDGVPLSTEETGRLWQEKRGSGLDPRVGPERRPVPRARRGKAGEPEACACFWHLIECRNDVFCRDGRGSKSPAVMLVDDARKRQRWYEGSPPDTSEKKRYSSGTLMITEDPADAYPDLDAAYLEIFPPHKMPYYCRVRLTTPLSPYFSHYEISEDGGPPMRFEGMEYPWRLHPGHCSLEVRTVSVAGWRGAPYRMRLEIAEDRAAVPLWPLEVAE
ncbi:MAG: transglutaminase-like domain-containing protein [Planctomycetota bacterium]|nr:transglutaminase-like domain-containing protein [Planctomycetota bacterium]